MGSFFFFQIAKCTLHKKETSIVIMQQSYTQLIFSNQNAVTDVFQQSIKLLDAVYHRLSPPQLKGGDWHGTLGLRHGLGADLGSTQQSSPQSPLAAALPGMWMHSEPTPRTPLVPSCTHISVCHAQAQHWLCVPVCTRLGSLSQTGHSCLFSASSNAKWKRSQAKVVLIIKQTYFTVIRKTSWFSLVSVFTQKIKHDRKELRINSLSIYSYTLSFSQNGLHCYKLTHKHIK